MKFKYLLLCTALIIPAGISRAQQIKPATADTIKFTLQQAIEFARKNNLNVKNAVLDLESAKKQVWEYTAMGLPQVNGEADYQNIFKVPAISFGPSIDYYSLSKLPSDHVLTVSDLGIANGGSLALGVKENITYDVSVSQLIFSGQYLVGLQASRILKELSEQALSKSEFDTRASVSQSYYLVLISQEGLRILESSLNAVNKTLSDMEAMNQQGLIEGTDVDQIRVNKLNIENLVRTTQASSELAYRLLKFQLGLNLNQPIALTDNLDHLIAARNFTISTNEEFNINNNIDYKMMLTAEQLANMNLKHEMAMNLPTLSAFYRHLEQVKKPEFNFNFPNLLAVHLAVPIFSSGMRMSRVAQAKIALEKSSNQRELVQQGTTIAFQQSRINYNKALSDYENLKQSVDLSDKIYQKTLIKYKEGVSSSLELTQAQNQFLQTESNYYTAIMALFSAQTALERLMATE